MTRKRIWIPEYSDSQVLTKPEMSVGFRFRMGGIFKVELIDAATGKVKQYLEFPNLITDAGLDSIMGQTLSQTSLFNYIGVGTDNSAPTVGDTTLGAEVDRTNSNGGFTLEEIVGYVTGTTDDFDGAYHFRRFVRLFLEGEGNGNLTELAWFASAAGSTMAVRSLFKDSGGTPITVTKTTADQLKITYDLRLYPPIGNDPDALRSGSFSLIDSGTVILGSTTHSWTASVLDTKRSAVWGWFFRSNFPFQRGALKHTLDFFSSRAMPSGSELINVTGTQANFSVGPIANSSFAIDAYVAGTFERTGVSTWEPGAANFGPGGVKGFTVNMSSGEAVADHFQVIVSESIPKTSVDRLKIKWKVAIDRDVF